MGYMIKLEGYYKKWSFCFDYFVLLLYNDNTEE